MHTLREKATASVAIAAGEPVFFQATADPTKFELVGIAGFVAGDKFAGIAVEACGASEVCYYAPPGADALFGVIVVGPWLPGDIVYFEEGGSTLVAAPTAAVDQAIARVKPIRSLDETVSSVAGPNYIAVTVLNGLPF